jgi:hypothetical protein
MERGWQRIQALVGDSRRCARADGAFVRVVGLICLIVVFVAVAVGAASSGRADSGLILHAGPAGTSRSTDVFRLKVSLDGRPPVEEWMSPGTGDYSTEFGNTKYWLDRDDALIDRRSDFGGVRDLYHGDHGYLRAVSSRDFYFLPGSAIVRGFLSGVAPRLPDEPEVTSSASTVDGHSVLVLSYASPRTGGGTIRLNWRVEVVERIRLSEARRRGLFASTVTPTSTTWESRPGTGSRLGLAAYWLGPRIKGHAAVMVREHTKTKQSHAAYSVWYAAPASGCPMRDFTAGKNNWWPGLDNDGCDTWNITTWAPDTPIFEHGKHTTSHIRLADGTPADVIKIGGYIEMFVRTKRALIEIGANFIDSADGSRLFNQQLELARSLRLVRP